MKQKLNKTKRGQSLLIVMVISSLTLLVIIAIADRILLSRVNIQKIKEFNRSIANSENRINQIVGLMSKRSDPNVNACLSSLDLNNSGNTYVHLTGNSNCSNVLRADNIIGQNIQNNNFRVFGRRLNNSYISLSNDANNSNPSRSFTILLSNNLNQGIETRDIRVSCQQTVNNVLLVVTRVFVDQGLLDSDKGILYGTCSSSTESMINMYHHTNIGNSISSRNNTLYVTFRLISAGSVSLRANILNSQNNLVGSSDKYEFVVTASGGYEGALGLGSDSVAYFEVGAGTTYISNGSTHPFEYAYFEY